MSKQHEPRPAHAARARLSGLPAPSGAALATASQPGAESGGGQPAAPQLTLSGLVHRALLSFGERDQQRRRLLNILLLVQALLLLAAAPAALGETPSLAGFAVVGGGLVIALAAWLFNQAFQDVVRATYLLVVGEGAVALAQVFVAAVTGHDIVSASFAALLVLPIILDAGLLFAPDMTGLVASGAIALTAVGLVLAVTLGPAASQRQTYVIIATVLGVEVAAALIAWLLSRFIADTAVEAARAHALQIAQARLEGLTVQAAAQRRRIESGAASLREGIARALADDSQARVEPPGAELAALAGAINLLLERLDSARQADVARRPDAASLPLGVFDGAGALAAGDAPVHAALTRRLERIQETAGEVMGGLTHGESGLAATAESASEALRTVGAAIAAADGVLTAAQKSSDLTQRALRALGALAPAAGVGVTSGELLSDAVEPLDAAQAAALLGLGPDLDVGGPGMTTEFTMLDAHDFDGTGLVPDEAAASIAAPLAVNGGAPATSEPDGTAPAAPSRRRKGARSLTSDMIEQLEDLGRLLAQLHDESARQERGATALTHELGLANRHTRGVDVGVAWARQALEAIRRNAERLRQTAGGGAFPAALPPADLPRRAPLPTRPLAESGKLTALPDALPEALTATTDALAESGSAEREAEPSAEGADASDGRERTTAE